MKYRSNQIICSILLIAASLPIQIHSAQEPKPWIADLQFPSDDLVPIVSYDVTKSPYSADSTGQSDCTAAFEAALADADKMGGTVYAPAGQYRFDGEISIPMGVTLRGDWKRPTEEDATVGGTIFMVYAGKGSTDGQAFLTANVSSVRDVTIFYPEQDVQSIRAYPVTIDLKGSATAKNVTLVNSYRGIITGSFSTVLDLYATTLDTGLTMLSAAAVPRCRLIRFSPRYWGESGLDGAPSESDVRDALRREKAFAIQLNRQDAGIFMDAKVEGYHTAVKFMPPHGWTYWYDIEISDCEVGVHFTGGSHQRMYMTSSQIEASQTAILMEMDKTGWDEKGWLRISKSKKPFGLPKDLTELRMFDCTLSSGGSVFVLDGSYKQEINLQECILEKWGQGPDDYAINITAGVCHVYDSEFKGSKRHIRSQGKKDLLQVVGNEFDGLPDVEVANKSEATIDHQATLENDRAIRPIQPVPNYLPTRTGPDALYVATDSSFGTPNDGQGDASSGIQKALDQAGRDGGGTVYLPQGLYRLTEPITIPAGVELRGANDMMPRGSSTRSMLLADRPQDRGKEDGTPLIRLGSDPELGGAGLAGLAIYYLHQDYTDIQSYPWTIQGLGPACWVQRVFLSNTYNSVDFATHDSDRHVLSRVSGSSLNIAFMVGQSKTIGWIDNCHIRPQDWSLSSAVEVKNKNGTLKKRGYFFDIPSEKKNKPTTKDIFRGTEYSLIPNMRGSGAITVGSGANVQVTAFFTNGATRAFDFVDHLGTGGGNANILIGGTEAGWGAWIKALGDEGITLTNFSFNPMTRLPYVEPDDIPPGNLPKGMAIRVEPTVGSKPITMVQPKLYGRGEIEYGIDLRGGDMLLKQGMNSGGYKISPVKVSGGEFRPRNSEIIE
ncbi:MAG: glycosyl hydrolase family 28-related protein [Verrucomicrobiota bacterium]